MKHISIALFTLSLITTTTIATDDGYRRPPQNIVDIVTTPPLPTVGIDPTRTYMLLGHRPSMPSIVDLSEPMLRLAGNRINARTNGWFSTFYLTGFTLRNIETGWELEISTPVGARLGNARWSPNGARFAYTIRNADSMTLHVYDIALASTIDLGVVNTLGGFSWMPDSEHLLVHRIPDDRGAAPPTPRVPTGPVIQATSGSNAPLRTYQDLLQNPHDVALFKHYFTSQLELTDLKGTRRKLGGPAIYNQTSSSPDQRYLLVSRIEEPFSYMVPMSSFPQTIEVWEIATMKKRVLLHRPIAEQVPIGGVVIGPRSHHWRPTVGTSSLLWVEALDGGDPKREVPHRDCVVYNDDPMNGSGVEVARLEDRYAGLSWIEQSNTALLSEYDRDERWSRTWLLAIPSSTKPKLVFERNVQDRYADPGRPVMTTNTAGRSVVMLHNGSLYLSGSGGTPEGDRPFLHKMNLDTLDTQPIWRCQGEQLERFVDFLDVDAGVFMTRAETPSTPPNYYRHDGDTRIALTTFKHPSPQLRDIRKELVTYTRDDGVTLSATLYLPPNFVEGKDDPLPLLVWAYPREFNNARTASQISGSPYRFTSISGSSHLFMLLQGYAIMDRATMPVVGADPETVNDTFIEQIVASAAAAIDYAALRGVGDPERVGVGGHSYGAFMTANLLAHCDLFSAGVARSGAYNRTLTPFGFQSERRTFWEAPDIYFELSPFMHADTVNEPILFIHGEMDNNSGTFPIQSKRMYHAVKGHGGTARLVMLPNESHGYRAEESIMHVLAEMLDWFDLYVKRESDQGVANVNN